MRYKKQKNGLQIKPLFLKKEMRYELDFLILKKPFRQGKHPKPYLPVRQVVFNKV